MKHNIGHLYKLLPGVVGHAKNPIFSFSRQLSMPLRWFLDVPYNL